MLLLHHAVLHTPSLTDTDDMVPRCRRWQPAKMPLGRLAQASWICFSPSPGARGREGCHDTGKKGGSSGSRTYGDPPKAMTPLCCSATWLPTSLHVPCNCTMYGATQIQPCLFSRQETALSLMSVRVSYFQRWLVWLALRGLVMMLPVACIQRQGSSFLFSSDQSQPLTGKVVVCR